MQLKDLNIMQQKLRILQQSLGSVTTLRSSFKGQRGMLMENGNRYLLSRLCEAAHKLNERHIALLPAPKKPPVVHTGALPKQTIENPDGIPRLEDDMLLSRPIVTMDEEYQQQIGAMYNSLQSVRTLYQEIQNMVMMQGEQLEHVVMNLERAANHAEMGTTQIEIRAEKERVNTKLLAMLVITVLIFISTLGLIYKKTK